MSQHAQSAVPLLPIPKFTLAGTKQSNDGFIQPPLPPLLRRSLMESEVTAEPMTLEQQVEYWQERFFAEQDEKVALINQLNAIERIIHPAALTQEEP